MTWTLELAAGFYLPTEDQWYKAAYYDPRMNRNKGGYYRYATSSDTAPSNQIGNAANMANYIDDYTGTYFYSVPQSRYIDPNQNDLLDAGAYTGSARYYGTYDQSVTFAHAAATHEGADAGIRLASPNP